LLAEPVLLVTFVLVFTNISKSEPATEEYTYNVTVAIPPVNIGVIIKPLLFSSNKSEFAPPGV
jgi:hypothetical protein